MVTTSLRELDDELRALGVEILAATFDSVIEEGLGVGRTFGDAVAGAACLIKELVFRIFKIRTLHRRVRTPQTLASASNPAAELAPSL